MSDTRIPNTAASNILAETPPSRFGSTVKSGKITSACRVGLIGFPDDEGVRLNHGRTGAKDGPRAFREALTRYGVATPEGFEWPLVFDAGDVISGRDIDETHSRVTEAVAALLELGLFPIAVGGGHDLTFPFVRAVARHYPDLKGVYCDAHLDVRPEIGSGMAFRKIIEECKVRELHNQGFRPFVNSRDHVIWFKDHGGQIEAFGSNESWPPGDLFLSLDLDVISSVHAPGVSAPNPSGWSVYEAEQWVVAAGRNVGVRSFDIMEMNPTFDIDGRTARLAVYLFLCFLHAYAQRDG